MNPLNYPTDNPTVLAALALLAWLALAIVIVIAANTDKGSK